MNFYRMRYGTDDFAVTDTYTYCRLYPAARHHGAELGRTLRRQLACACA